MIQGWRIGWHLFNIGSASVLTRRIECSTAVRVPSEPNINFDC
jgi:hypothetical protein